MAFAAASLVSSLGVGLESSAASTFAWPAYHSNTELYAEWQKLADSSYCKDKMNLVNEDESVDGWKLKTATFGTGDTKVMYVFGSMCSPGILPDQLCADSCFAFYNPTSQPELEHYVNSWLENLVAASEHVVANPRPHRKLR